MLKLAIFSFLFHAAVRLSDSFDINAYSTRKEENDKKIGIKKIINIWFFLTSHVDVKNKIGWT